MRNTLVIFSSLLAVSLAVITAPESLYFYSKLESVTQASDETGRVANATAVGTPTAVAGYNGFGIEFNPVADGAATDVLNFPPLDLAGDVTYSVWFYLQSADIPNGKVFSNKVNFNDALGNEVEVFTGAEDGGNKLNYVHANQKVDGVLNQPWLLNTWYHVVIAGSDTDSFIYINGTLRDKIATSSGGSGVAVPNAGKPFSVGSSTLMNGDVNAGGAFRGIVDEMRVYNVTFTQAQVTALFGETFDVEVSSTTSSTASSSDSSSDSTSTSATSSTFTSSGITANPSTTIRSSASTAVVSFFVVVCSFLFMF
eukprot:TRINITY_DN285_c0_g1_i1.p1 TRINITY_DN285_c0_g1~~TRINITY_DN285_c0_g1_i1.p1  ORF type:complete len:311 (+),score=79.57 TRINITY_DN285_c0_g1_i1:245-1177(+)